MTGRRAIADHVAAEIAARAVNGRIAVNDLKRLRAMTVVVSAGTDAAVAIGSAVADPAAADTRVVVRVAERRRRSHSIARRPA